MQTLETLAHVAAILTFLIALFGYAYYLFGFYWKRVKVEGYLKRARDIVSSEKNGKKGIHTAFHLMKEVGVTEEEILQASFHSKHIKRYVSVDEDTGRANGMMFGYQD
jgi:hypothetical protein